MAEFSKDQLEAFTTAWNRRDIDAIMSFMSENCVFESSAGTEAYGTRFAGPAEVRRAFAAVLAYYPDAHWSQVHHMVDGERGATQWLFTGTEADGTREEVEGCDLFVFKEGQIASKRTFLKNREVAEAS